MPTRILSFFLFLCFTFTARAEKPVKVFLLGGQSNMVGSGQVADLHPPYSEPLKTIQIWSQKEKAWKPLHAGHGTGQGRFGPEVAFGHELTKLLPGEDVRLVKYAAGGTALYNDWAPTTGGPYNGFMKTARAALKNLDDAGTTYEILGMLWLQGESDAHEKKGETYEKNLTDFIAHLREQFNTPEMPFLVARVLAYYGGTTGEAKIVRDAQVKVAESTKNGAWFDTDDCPVVDPVKNQGHYNARGLIMIGQRFAIAYKSVAK